MHSSLNSLDAVKGTCNQRRLWSDWTDVQADLSLCWLHMSYCRFCLALVHFIFILLANLRKKKYFICCSSTLFRNTCIAKFIYTTGGRKYLDLLLFLKNRWTFFKNSFYFSKYSPSTSIHFCHLRGSFCIPSANHEVDCGKFPKISNTLFRTLLA